MVSRVFSAGLSGIDGYIVTVECFLSGGLPRLDVVGLPTGAVSEAGERVRAAAKACAFDWPVSRLTVNLAPADTKKAGTAYDLPILLSILAAAGEIDAPPDNALFFGELSLTGELRPVCGALSMALAARDAGFKTVFVPAMNAAEASYASGVTVFPIRTLNELLGHLNGRKPLTPCAPPPRPEPQDDALDFAHVLGQHVDPLGEDGHLDLGRAGVPLVGAVGVDDRGLLFFAQHENFHLSSYIPAGLRPGIGESPRSEGLGPHIHVLLHDTTEIPSCKDKNVEFSPDRRKIPRFCPPNGLDKPLLLMII